MNTPGDDGEDGLASKATGRGEDGEDGEDGVVSKATRKLQQSQREKERHRHIHTHRIDHLEIDDVVVLHT